MMAVAGIGLSSCNTYIGMGRDIQKLGEGIQNTGYGSGWSGNQPPAQQTTQPVPAQPSAHTPAKSSN